MIKYMYNNEADIYCGPEKRATLFSTIALALRERLLRFLYRWKQKLNARQLTYLMAWWQHTSYFTLQSCDWEKIIILLFETTM